MFQLIEMYFNRDPCPVSAAAEIQFCAAQGRDHRECCARNGNFLFHLKFIVITATFFIAHLFMSPIYNPNYFDVSKFN